MSWRHGMGPGKEVTLHHTGIVTPGPGSDSTWGV